MIVIGGFGEIAVEACKYLINNTNQTLLGVIPRINDNGTDTWQPSLRKFANNNAIDVISLNDIYDIDDLVFISLEFDRIIDISKFKSKSIYNIHFSLLPKYKGMYTSIWPILNGEKYSGVTLHRIDNGIDTGNIICQQPVEIDINDTAKDLYLKLNIAGLKLFNENVDSLINNNFNEQPQQGVDSSYYSKNSINFESISINLRQTSFQIHNQIRAFIFKEFQLPSVGGFRISKSIYCDTKVSVNLFIEENDKFIISGIDGYEINVYKENGE